MTIAIAALINKMPLLVDLRPDFVLGKWTEIVRQEAISIAEQGQFIERTYHVPLQCGVTEYLLDECEEEIHTIKSICSSPSEDGTCRATETRSIVANGWCMSPASGHLRLRYIPENQIEVDAPTANDTGKVLIITASVTPRQNACEIDELFATKYRTALHYAAARTALEYPGDGQSNALASNYAKRATDELTRLWVKHRSGHENKSLSLRAKRLV